MVLIILAVISINAVMGENGLIRQAEKGAQFQANAEVEDNAKLDELDGHIANVMDKDEGESIPKIDWDKIIEEIPTKYDEYLEEAQEKGQDTEEDIGIGTDGEVVNLKLWQYFKTDDGTGLTLGKNEGSWYQKGYIGSISDEGEIDGKIPQYIYIKAENKIYPVNMLSYTFGSYSNLRAIPEIPTTVTKIDSTFVGCTNLESITIPSSVTTIGYNAFNYCNSLTNIEIPSSVITIGTQAFNYCNSLTNIEIPSSVITIGYQAFNSCRDLTNITIPSSVTTIDHEAFSWCENLQSVIIEEGVISIGQGAFENCKNLTNITIPSSVTTIGNAAFASCESLTEIKIPSLVTTIPSSAFHSCYSLANITIPSSITAIGDYAFYNCEDLAKVTFEHTDTVPTFGSSCFCGFSSSRVKTTYNFKNSTIASAFIAGTHYDADYAEIVVEENSTN